MQQNFLFKAITAIFAVAFVIFSTSCSSKKNYSFNTPDEVIVACQNTLTELRSTEKVDVKKLSAFIRDWNCLQDSAYSCLTSETIDSISDNIIESYFTLSDSIKDEIMRLATSEPRTLSDVLKLKINTANNREEILSSGDYKNALVFYETLDKNQIYPNVPTTVVKYNALLSKSFQDEKEMYKFIENEDRCFRSLMAYLPQIEQEELQYITNRTSSIFETVTKNIARKSNEEQSNRIRTFLNIRFNRRIVGNAMVCRADILTNKKLDETQKMNYRWMLIQPLLSIDNSAMAYITDKQEDDLKQLVNDLPVLLLKLDGTKLNADEEKKLSSILTDYLLKSYINATI